MNVEEILNEARDVIMYCLADVMENSVFPERCETDEYLVSVEDGAILIPTKFKAAGERVFVRLDLSLMSM